jgi:hypothetical protein
MAAASTTVVSSDLVFEQSSSAEQVAQQQEEEPSLEVMDLFPESRQLRRSGNAERALQYMAPNKYCNWCGGPPSIKLGVVILGLGQTSCHGAYQAGLNSQLPGNYCQPTRAYLYKKCGCGQKATGNQYGSNGRGNWKVKGSNFRSNSRTTYGSRNLGIAEDATHEEEVLQEQPKEEQ